MGRRPKENGFLAVTRAQAAQIFGVTQKAISEWVGWGAPLNPDGTMNTEAVFRWYLDREIERVSTGGLKDKKLELECQRLQAQIQKINDETVERTYHEQTLVSRAATLRQFFEKTAMMNSSEFVGLSMDQARTKLSMLFRRALNEYSEHKEDGNAVPASKA